MNFTETKVMKFYKKIKILKPAQLSIEKISRKIDISIVDWEYSSEVVRWQGKTKVFLNGELNDRQKWQEFGHEMKHVLFDVGRQEFLPEKFVYFQEYKADHFAYHFCIPTFMLEQMKPLTTRIIMSDFNVEYSFAAKRLEMYQNRIISKGG